MIHEVKSAIKILLANRLQVNDGFVNIYRADGEMASYEENEPVPYIICTTEFDGMDEEHNIYQEFIDLDQALDFFLKHTGHIK